jgi:hypothetical protein
MVLNLICLVMVHLELLHDPINRSHRYCWNEMSEAQLHCDISWFSLVSFKHSAIIPARSRVCKCRWLCAGRSHHWQAAHQTASPQHQTLRVLHPSPGCRCMPSNACCNSTLLRQLTCNSWLDFFIHQVQSLFGTTAFSLHQCVV